VFLFRTLFNLQLRSSNKPTEDYLTEIFAYCLSESDELLSSFLIHFKIHEAEIKESTVSTQLRLKALEDHAVDSRPDMAVFLDKKIIFFENKLGSGEGDEQLPRYAEHLDQFVGKKVLVYLTRDFDPKDEAEIKKNCQGQLDFVHIRWFEVYQFLQQYAAVSLVKQLLEFMKSLKLDMSNQFSPVDILTLSNFSRVRKLLNETMYGVVSKRFEELTKSISSKTASLTQIRHHDRYIYFSYQKDGLWVGLGYWLNSFTDKPYSDLVFIIEVGPKSSRRNEILEAFKEIVAKNDSKWRIYNANDPTGWASIRIVSSLKNFLKGEDHISNTQAFFMEALDEFQKIKDQNPELPWREK
jgi:hypothetical protein